jgi:ribonucleoside-diphosphate reductase alpha chain
MFLLLGGTGVGYSVQRHHVEKLPEIRKPNQKRTRRFLIADSIEGWADAVKALTKSYFTGGSKLKFESSTSRISDLKELG